MLEKARNKLESKFEMTVERINKLFKRGKVMYYIPHIIIITISNVVLFYLFIDLVKLDLLNLSGFDYVYLAFIIGNLIFITYNILLPVTTRSGEDIEQKYEEMSDL